jgi:glutamyl-tRNA(Gln) amidotransferase subunit E
LEEDACREVSDVGHRRTYLTDRLGMPLIETVTGPDMRTPGEVAEVAEVLRKLVRSTGLVRTGPGAARQDVNVSVTGGTRIEIKGVPRIPNIPLLTYNEAMRQFNLLRLRDELHHRDITKDTLETKVEEVTRLLRKTRFEPVRNAIAEGQTVHCVLLRGFKGLLRWQTQTDTYFSREISDRVRVVACLTTLPNIIHSDSPSETLSSSEWQLMKKSIGATEGDTVVLVWGNHVDAATGASEIVIRAKEATIGVPSETRQALRDGTNGFERILPGPDRMYPDTDLPPRRITKEHLAAIRQSVPRPYWEHEQRYRELGLPADVIAPLAISPLAGLFETAVNEWKLPPTLAAVALVQFPKRVARKLRRAVDIPHSTLHAILHACSRGALAKEGILPALLKAAGGNGFSPETLLPPCSNAELSSAISEARQELAGLKLHNPSRESLVLMGLVMNKVRGRIDGKTVAERLAPTAQEAQR